MNWYKKANNEFQFGDKVNVKSKFPYDSLKSGEGTYYYVDKDDKMYYVTAYPPVYKNKGDAYQISISLYNLEKI